MKSVFLRIALVLMFSGIMAMNAYSQVNYLKLSGQYRARTEFRNGYRTLMTDSSKPAFFVGQRARLMFDYKKENIQLYTSVQDARTWGDEEQRKDLGGLQVNELWMELKLKRGFALKMGRQELVYDDHRLFGNLDWANLTISHDALLLKYYNENNKFRWHLGAAFNQVGEPIFGTNYALKNYKALGFSYIKKEFDKGHTFSAIAIVNGMNSSTPGSNLLKATLTIGPLYNYSANNWRTTLGAYFQGGKIESNHNVCAFMINAYAERKIETVSLGLGGDYLSGNNDRVNVGSESNNFNTLYATNHKFYGYMDYFLSIPADAKQRGLVDLYARVKHEANKKVSTTLDLHYFSLANENNLGVNKIKCPLGAEADLLIDYTPSPIIHLQFGYSLLFATRNMEFIKGGNANELNTWAYLMLKVSPTLLYNEFKK
ncbi:MAG: alginate export family protein [Bacteroidetes bacterium]|nr:alginate export family protein [Bacteroidota bacterium]MBP8115972.1 alginate export family protein [Chitinophagaceae bacterium]